MVLVFLQVCYCFCECSDHKIPWVLSDLPDQIFLINCAHFNVCFQGCKIFQKYGSLYSRTACKCQNIITSIRGRRLLENIMNNKIPSMTSSGYRANATVKISQDVREALQLNTHSM